MRAPAAASARAAGPLRVLMVNDLPPGPGSGTEVFLDRLVVGLRRVGHTVDVVTPATARRGAGRLGDLWYPALRRRVRDAARGCDIVHVHNFARECSSSVLDAAPGVPVVCSVHDHRLFVSDRPGARWTPGSVASRALVRFARARVRRHAALVTAASPELAERLLAAEIRPVVLVSPFADPDPEPWHPAVGRDIVFAGRLAPGKGVDVLLAAFAVVAAADPDARLRIAGEGPDAGALRRRAGPLGDRVRFDGLLDQAGVRALLRDARVVCVPSVAPEGLPLLLVEAMLAGRAVVASDQPSMRRALADGALGVLVAPGDPVALAGSLLALGPDDARVESLGRAARAAAEHRYATTAAVDRFVEVYREALGRRD